MITGFYVRAHKDGKWQSIDITELSNEELEAFFFSINAEGRLNWLKALINFIKDLPQN